MVDMKTITLETILALRPCGDYPEERLRALIGDGVEVASARPLLLTLPTDDARWVLSELLTPKNAVVWAQGCAERAKGYANANANANANADATRCAADYATRYANAAADYAAADAYAACAAAAAARCAAYYAKRAVAEHRTACEHALKLIGAQS